MDPQRFVLEISRFLVAAMVFQFVWSLAMLLVEVLQAFKKLPFAMDKRLMMIFLIGEFVGVYLVVF